MTGVFQSDFRIFSFSVFFFFVCFVIKYSPLLSAAWFLVIVCWFRPLSNGMDVSAFLIDQILGYVACADAWNIWCLWYFLFSMLLVCLFLWYCSLIVRSPCSALAYMDLTFDWLFCNENKRREGWVVANTIWPGRDQWFSIGQRQDRSLDTICSIRSTITVFLWKWCSGYSELPWPSTRVIIRFVLH